MTVPRPVTSQGSPWESLCVLSLPSSLAVVLSWWAPGDIPFHVCIPVAVAIVQVLFRHWKVEAS